jgi:hypothetical protein
MLSFWTRQAIFWKYDVQNEASINASSQEAQKLKKQLLKKIKLTQHDPAARPRIN